jgi:hypothetical protein
VSHEHYELIDEDIKIRNSELAAYIYELRKMGYLDFLGGDPMVTRGFITKYNNKVFSVMYPEYIVLEPLGKAYIQHKRMKRIDKMTARNKKFVMDIIAEIRKQFINHAARSVLIFQGTIAFMIYLVIT